MNDGLVQLPDGVREGDDLAGKYRIGAIIGAGASGTVVAARHNLLGQKVAIKFLHSDPAEQADAVSRFVQEAQAAMSIQSEHVVRVRDVAMLDGGVPYIVMEHLEGSDLASTLFQSGPLAIEDAVDYVLEACEAIAEAHRLGIIHRDLKPANLFLVQRSGALPSIKVLDFGISKSTGLVPKTLGASRAPASADMTDANAVLGSPFYMSPEQMESTRDVDSRTDIWALGVTLFELLTGSRPYVGNSIVQVYSKIVARGPHSWRQALVNCPSGLAAIIGKCLARDRDRRYPSVGDLARALKRFGSARAEVSLLRINQTLAGSGVVQSSTLDPHMLRSPESAPATGPQSFRTPLRRDRVRARRRMLAAIIAGVAAGSALMLGAVARKTGSEARRATAGPAPAVVAAQHAEVAQHAGAAPLEHARVMAEMPPMSPAEGRQEWDQPVANHANADPAVATVEVPPSLTRRQNVQISPHPAKSKHAPRGLTAPAPSSRFAPRIRETL